MLTGLSSDPDLQALSCIVAHTTGELHTFKLLLYTGSNPLSLHLYLSSRLSFHPSQHTRHISDPTKSQTFLWSHEICISSYPHLSSSPAGLRINPRLPCCSHLPPEPSSHSCEPQGLPQQWHWCLCGWAGSGVHKERNTFLSFIAVLIPPRTSCYSIVSSTLKCKIPLVMQYLSLLCADFIRHNSYSNTFAHGIISISERELLILSI